ncbi:DoxX family protein [Chitinophaga agrisoli]|uniref:DoxX family protein n=1 Tax=Chitinophaga agrisoli TaxID=2607653 RepID=A0A5B2VUU5_9BACT|nr:DoxX family protein [Chitinophaga agrisoli]KAA2242544.1 DoxX family protein [Chitinophaga agrisoli]
MSILPAYANWASSLYRGRALPLLFMRLILAYGFLEAARMKWSDIGAVISWFTSAGFPFPTVSAYMVAIFEGAGVALLALGLLTRVIAIPLMIIMLVAIFAVHWPNGFSSAKNGFEIPLYYLIMLLTLLIMGPGSISIDEWVRKKNEI